LKITVNRFNFFLFKNNIARGNEKINKSLFYAFVVYQVSA